MLGQASPGRARWCSAHLAAALAAVLFPAIRPPAAGSLGLTLRPGRAVLEQHTTLYNRSDTRHRFYWWTNAGVQVEDDSRILYPMRFTAAHGFADIDTWPVNAAGVDLSLVGNHTFGPVSRFAHGSREPFMAVYHPRTDSGVVHHSSSAERAQHGAGHARAPSSANPRLRLVVPRTARGATSIGPPSPRQGGGWPQPRMSDPGRRPRVHGSRCGLHRVVHTAEEIRMRPCLVAPTSPATNVQDSVEAHDGCLTYTIFTRYRIVMSKQAISVTLDAENVTWLKGRAGAAGLRSVSALLDRIVSAARASGRVGPARSVVGTIDIDAADPFLEQADAALRAVFETSLGRPLVGREARTDYRLRRGVTKKRRG
jgi:hypothetical protein